MIIIKILDENDSNDSKMSSVQEKKSNKNQLLINENKINQIKNSIETNNNCDPHKKCCAKESEIKSLVRGCSIGYHITDDGSIVQCIPDDCE